MTNKEGMIDEQDSIMSLVDELFGHHGCCVHHGFKIIELSTIVDDDLGDEWKRDVHHAISVSHIELCAYYGAKENRRCTRYSCPLVQAIAKKCTPVVQAFSKEAQE